MSDGGKLYTFSEGFTNPSARPLGEGSKTVVLFINGILTDRQTFSDNIYELNKLIIRLPVTGGVGLYNVSGTDIADDLARYICPFYKTSFLSLRGTSVIEQCTNHLYNSGKWQDLAQAIKQYVGIMFNTGVSIDDVAVLTLRDTLLATVEAGRRVIIVAHSQGNFFVHNALEQITRHYGGYGRRYLKSIGVIMVASPLYHDQITELGVQNRWVESCFDVVPLISRGMDFVSVDVPKYFGPTGLINVDMIPFIKAPTECHDGDTAFKHDFIGEYLTGETRYEIIKSLYALNTVLKFPQEIFEQNDHIETTDNLMVRNITGLSTSFPYYYVPSGSLAQITDQGQTLDGYQWYHACFKSGTVSHDPNTGVVNSDYSQNPCGYVASNWLSFDGNNPPVDHDPNFTAIIPQSDITYLNKDNAGILAVAGGLVLDPPNANDEVVGFGGCEDCSTAPEPFSVVSDEATDVVCNNNTADATVRWTSSTGAGSYNVYRDGELLSQGETGLTYTETNVALGSNPLYFVKAVGNGTRNGNTSWNPEIPETLCGNGDRHHFLIK